MPLSPQYRTGYLRWLDQFGFLVVIFAALTVMSGCKQEDEKVISSSNNEEILVALKDKTFDELVFINVYAFFMGDECKTADSSANKVANEEGLYPCSSDKNDALPVQLVSMNDFSIQAYEVIYQDFDIYTLLTGKDTVAEKLINTSRRQARHPVTMVTWSQARAYCHWLGDQIGYPMDLPTEAQWESAARDGMFSVAYATDDGEIKFGVNISHPETHPFPMLVGSWPPSPAGLYDMTGNVEEWTLDLWHRYTTNPPYNPSYVDKSNQPNEYRRVTRGSGVTDNVQDLKLYRRTKRDPAKAYPNVGFRCVVNHDELTINKERIARQSELFNFIDRIRKYDKHISHAAPFVKSMMLYDIVVAPVELKEIESDSDEFDQFKEREEAALLTIINGIVSVEDWNETIALIGELRDGTMIPHWNINAFQKSESIRIKENTAWLRKNLLRDKDDWKRVQDHLQTLRLKASITEQVAEDPRAGG